MMGKDIRVNSLEEKYGIPEPSRQDRRKIRSEAKLGTVKKAKLSPHPDHEGMINKIKLPILKCLRCGYEWIPRQPKYLKYCASCNSPCWNKPKAKQSGSKRAYSQTELCDDDACSSDDDTG